LVNDSILEKAADGTITKVIVGEAFRNGSKFNILQRKINSEAIDWMLANYQIEEHALCFHTYDLAMSENVQNIREKVKKSVNIINNYRKSVEDYVKVNTQHQSQTILNSKKQKIKFIHSIVCLEEHILNINISDKELAFVK
jgi:hypothetical protein